MVMIRFIPVTVIAVVAVAVVAGTICIVSVAAIAEWSVTRGFRGESSNLLREKANYLGLRCDKGGRVDLGELELEADAETADHSLYLFLGGLAWVDVFRPCCVDREGLQLDDVTEGRKGSDTTGSVEVSDHRKNTSPIGFEGLVPPLWDGQTV